MHLSEFPLISSVPPEASELWNEGYKIPWNDPAFSERMLQEHLSQDHELASRSIGTIQGQTDWLTQHGGIGAESSILDLGCGPGLYATPLTASGASYTGIDFGPATIRYAQERFAVVSNAEFKLGDIVHTDYGNHYSHIIQLYGEINVFSENECRTIFAKAHEALQSGGTFYVEIQTEESVRASVPACSWYSAEQGLFMPAPHICLSQSFWYETEMTALQLFHIIDTNSGEVTTYKSTTRAWPEATIISLLKNAGFTQITLHPHWPSGNPALQLFSARRPA
ncbi:class I SAM-dependent methyltransferase [Oleidesulfovibrio sp.]|uniref:class I SAM-dependent methyltransferase n=1 Tax=Oleidesulfovibrio sp. TaxID=2909707 RepID=UPI003A8A4449